MMKSFFVDLIIIFFASILSVVGLHMFIETAGFAAVGVDGISVMMHKMCGINIGYISLVINIPLLTLAWFFLSKKYVIYTLIFNIISSVMLVFADKINLYQYITETNLWISVVVSGILHGIRTGMMIKQGGSAGGIDIVACMIQKKRPYLNIENSISTICYIISFLSFFVFGNIESVIMSILHMMVFNVAMASVMKSTRNAIKVTIITDEVEKFKNDIIIELKHGATIIPCKGMNTNDEKNMIVTVINLRQMNEFAKIVKKHPDAFVYYSDVNGVIGNFRWNKTDPAV